MKHNLRNMLWYMKYKNFNNESNRIAECKENLYDAIKENVEFFNSSDNHMYANQKMYFTVPIGNLNPQTGMTLDKFIEIQEQFNTAATGLFGLKYDNLAYIVLTDIYGHPFIANCHKIGNTYNLHVWDITGTKTLCYIETKSNRLTNEECRELCKCHEKMVRYYKGSN